MQNDSGVATEPEIDKPEEKPIKVSVQKLLDAYDSNEIAANEKYKGKLVKLTKWQVASGGVSDTLGMLSVRIEPRGADMYNFSLFSCSFSDEWKSILAKFTEGDYLEGYPIYGRVGEVLGFPGLTDCYFETK